MVVPKDKVCSREPRPQFGRSKSVGAPTRRTRRSAESRQHKKNPYSTSSDFRQRRKSSGAHVSPSGTNFKDIYRHQGTFENAFDNYHLAQFDCKKVNNISKDLKRQLSLKNPAAKGSNLSEEIPDFANKSLLSLPANIPHQPLCWTSGLLTDNTLPTRAGTDDLGPGELRPVCSQLVNNNVNNTSLPEVMHKLQADSSSAALIQVTNMTPEFLSDEKADKTPLAKMDDVPLTMTQQYSHRPGGRTARRPLAARNLEDNQSNVQGARQFDKSTECQRVRQPEARPVKYYTSAQMSRSGVNMSPDFNNDENVAYETKLTSFSPTEEDIYDFADYDVYSSRFGIHSQDCAMQHAYQTKIVPKDNEDTRNVQRCDRDTCEKSCSSLRRQDTLLLHQDNNIDDEKSDGDDHDDDNDFHSFCESLKSFLCQEIPNDSYLLQDNEENHDADRSEQDSDQARVSYKNLLNGPTRYQCVLCEVNLEVVPLQQLGLACQYQSFPFFSRADVNSQTDLYCPQCCCLRSVHGPQ